MAGSGQDLDYLEKMDNRAGKGAESNEWKNAQLIGKR
jgi:hypothetical protein